MWRPLGPLAMPRGVMSSIGMSARAARGAEASVGSVNRESRNSLLSQMWFAVAISSFGVGSVRGGVECDEQASVNERT